MKWTFIRESGNKDKILVGVDHARLDRRQWEGKDSKISRPSFNKPVEKDMENVWTGVGRREVLAIF